MELDDYVGYDDDDDYDKEDIFGQSYFNEATNNDSFETDTDFENTQEFKDIKKSWKALNNSTSFDNTYLHHIFCAASEVRGIVRRLSIQDRLDKLVTLLKIIDSKVQICPEEFILDLQCLVKTLIPFTNSFERSTQANLLNNINNIVANLEQLKVKSITHLLQLLKEKDATIAKLEKQIELLIANSTSESIGSSMATLNLSLSGELETLRRVSNVNDDTALLFKCNSCKQSLEKSFFSNSQLKQRANRKCKKCTTSTSNKVLSDASVASVAFK